MQGGKVAVAVEGVEMRAEGGLVPDALGWDARSALLGWRFYGYLCPIIKLVFPVSKVTFILSNTTLSPNDLVRFLTSIIVYERI